MLIPNKRVGIEGLFVGTRLLAIPCLSDFVVSSVPRELKFLAFEFDNEPTTPQIVERKPQAVERSLTDAEMEAKWNEHVEAAKRGVDMATREAADAWDAANVDRGGQEPMTRGKLIGVRY